ncbi:hypothetical protein BDQ17DRAFT_683200 [Cyathus striatus]|nr:hypothetical protein BDQ17DRAFT_683200 [Cyathus striatus]
MPTAHCLPAQPFLAPLILFRIQPSPRQHQLRQRKQQPSSNINNNQHASVSSSPPNIGHLYSSSSPVESQLYRTQAQTSSASSNNIARSTLWWGEIEPWMDEEYVKQVCNLMGWDPVSIKVPHPGPDQQANNLGYCFLTFPSPSHAAAVLSQINNSQKSGAPVTMPNSSRPFVLNWATNIATSTSPSAASVATASSFQNNNSNSFQGQGGASYQPQQQYQKEYSIFVGDLAPETSNSDLVAVFRNPVLGLRNDREPKFIRPFLSCKSAKIMLDPVTGVSRGYGFVRFTDEADQQRALIEMHGLYCLSRPMRISPATAKFKPPPSLPASIPFSPSNEQPAPLALPLPNTHQTKSVSAPIAASSSSGSLGSGQNGSGISMSGPPASLGISSGGALSGSTSNPNLSSYGQLPTSLSADDLLTLPSHVLQQIAQQYANSDAGAKFAASVGTTSTSSSASSPYAVENPGLSQTMSRLNGATEGGVPPRYAINEESWKHHAQARAILGNLIGPNGEQLTSTDPYNTTVFVGGLSPLISEETLRTFFAPFGDIHYVKVPVGKHCGFVQFVRKADAERAIEKMQGFPVGGSRIRLSWGRSQYKAAQAAAQAAQARLSNLQRSTLCLRNPCLTSKLSSFFTA